MFFNGIPAPILYSSGQQINVQVPFEVAGQTSVQMQLVNKQVPRYTLCSGTAAIGPAALAVNTDGTVNDCSNPAVAGSTVTLFVNGLGQLTPALTTGTMAAAPAVTLDPGVNLLGRNFSPLDTTTKTLPGALNGVEQVHFEAPASPGVTTSYAVTPTLLGVNLRERLASIWVPAE